MIKTITHGLNQIACGFARALIRIYQILLSPALHALLGSGSGCRHQPTCSRYAMVCFQKHPFPKAVWLTLKRISRCHPWGSQGEDPVPE